MKKMIILDGNNIMFRAYYATAMTGNIMQARSGLYTNAIYGFVNMITSVLKTEGMTNIFVAFDKGKKTKRHLEYSDYKGTRKKTPEEFAMQIPYIKEYLDVMGIKHLELDDFEADDIAGSMAVKASPYFDEIMVVSGDHDLLQLAHGNIHVYCIKKGFSDLVCYRDDNFKELLGIESNQMTDYKGLIGDSSDNLPGITGCGPKTACKLLEKYGTLENIVANIGELSGKQKENFINDHEKALKTKHLATLYTDVDLGVSIDETTYHAPSIKDLKQFYLKMDFVSLAKRLPSEEKEINSSNKNDTKEESETLKVEKKENSLVDISYYKHDYNRLLNDLDQVKDVAIDALLDGDNYHTSSLIGLSFVFDNKGYFISKDEIDDRLKTKLSNSELNIYALDSKKLYVTLNYLGIHVDHFAFDLLLGIYILDPSKTSEDVKLMYDLLISNELPFQDAIYGKKTKKDYSNKEAYEKYEIDKLKYIYNAKLVLDEKLKEVNALSLLYNMEIPLAVCLGDMEIAGFKVNKNRLEEIGKLFEGEMKSLEEQVYKEVGHEFNIASPKQLGEVLFDELKISKGKKNKTGYQTGAEILEKLAPFHPVPRLVLDYRKYAKLYNTYVTGLLDVMDKETNKVHTIFKQSVTLTGRLSSTEPNIQNIPIKTEDGRLIRSAFIPSTPDGMLVSADYSQIELRILAAASNCENMLNAFNNGLDLHSSTAAQIYGIEQKDVTKEMRRMAKAVNFGIVYGMSKWGLSEELGISDQEANMFINRYFSVNPEIKVYLDNVVLNCKQNGYTETLYHRRRYIPEINSMNHALRNFGERTAKNAPIQGTAADVIKLAMIKVHAKLKAYGLNSKLIAQVHDELVIDVVKGEEELVKKILKETMENVVSLKVKLNAEVSYGKCWDMK